MYKIINKDNCINLDMMIFAIYIMNVLSIIKLNDTQLHRYNTW